MTTFYWISGIIFAFYVLGVINTVYENHYKPHKYAQSLQRARLDENEKAELTAAKKRHPAGKRRG